jgi:hypothetical protein
MRVSTVEFDDQTLNGSRRHPDREQLPTRDHAVLAVC